MGNRKAAALAKRVTCVTNAEAAYASETSGYASSLKSQNDLLDYEVSVVGQMRAAMNGEQFGASPEMKTFDHCTDEKAAADTAATQCNGAKSDCEHSKITALNDGSTQTARRLLSADPCADETASCAAKAATAAAYCNAAEQAVIDKWDAKIAAAQAAWDAAAVVEANEIAEYNRLVGIKNDKQELYDAAVQRQAVEGALARSVHKDDVDGAWDYYTSMHGSITSIATADYAYLTEELESLQTVLDIVNQLNLDGDTNGEYVAPEHVTNDYATDTAEGQAAYHGATISEQNSEGRAGEGHAH